MLSLQSRRARLCDGISRRELLRAGGLSFGGLSLAGLLGKPALATATGGGAGSAKSCIVLFLMGGPDQHSTWDPKPDAPPEVRGAFAPISSRVPGVQFSELMPKLAQRADKLAVLRAVSTGDNAHSSSGYYMLTGRPHTPTNVENANPGFPNDWPNWGSVVQRLTEATGRRSGDLPTSMRLPNHIFNTDGSTWPGQDGGMLGHAADPWLFRCAPADPGFRIAELQLPDDVSLDRLAIRRDLVRDIDRQSKVASTSLLKTFGEHQQRAYGVLSSAASRGAFDLATESAETRARYGMTQFGQSCLLARRLVEANVRLVQVNWHRGPDEPSSNPCWDSHTDETNRLKNVLVPPTDDGFSSLLDDLSDRRMLDETLVVCMSEFGRSPRLNGAGGRDHWGSVFSVAMAGGGIRGGLVHGSSDALGAFPRSGLVRPEDIVATIFHCLGYAPETEIHDRQNRPHAICQGKVLQSLVG